MSTSPAKTAELEQQLLTLQEEVALLRRENTDLNERIKAYSAISTSQTSLINKLIDKVPFGVMLVNEEQRIIHANKEAEKIFSLPVSQLKGLNCNDLFDKANTNITDINGKEITLLENGKYVMHSGFVNDEGSNKVIVKNFIDVSEIKLAELELIRVNQTKDEFLGMISHELRSPLNVIQGFSSLLEDELKKVENADAISYLEHINNAGIELLHIVGSLLELSDLTAGKVNIDLIPIDIEMVISQLQYRLEKSFSDEGNKLVFHYKTIPPFEQDLALLMKMLYELLSNANKFTEAGEVVVSISLQNKEDKKCLCFEISDTGCGMSKETIEKIFGAFHQADASLSRSYEGLGLGLSLVEKIVKVIKGTVKVESEIGVGSTFFVYVPYYAVSNT